MLTGSSDCDTDTDSDAERSSGRTSLAEARAVNLGPRSAPLRGPTPHIASGSAGCVGAMTVTSASTNTSLRSRQYS